MWLVRGRRPAPLLLAIAAGFVLLASLSLAAPERPPDRTIEPFVWGRVETLLGWPVPEEPPPWPPSPPTRHVERHDLAQTPAKPLKSPTLNEWSAWDFVEDIQRDPQTYAIGDLRITFAAATQTWTGDDPIPAYSGAMVLVEAPGMTPYRLRRTDSLSIIHFGVGRIDGTRPGPQVLFGVVGGGRRCCIDYILLTPEGGRWLETSFVEIVSDAGYEAIFDSWPIDRDGDGSPELKMAESGYEFQMDGDRIWSPPVFLQARGGKVIDVSDRPGFRREYRAFAKDAEAACRRRDNSACAGFIHTAGRLGDDTRAWEIMLRSHDPAGFYVPDMPAYMERFRFQREGAGR